MPSHIFVLFSFMINLSHLIFFLSQNYFFHFLWIFFCKVYMRIFQKDFLKKTSAVSCQMFFPWNPPLWNCSLFFFFFTEYFFQERNHVLRFLLIGLISLRCLQNLFFFRRCRLRKNSFFRHLLLLF